MIGTRGLARLDAAGDWLTIGRLSYQQRCRRSRIGECTVVRIDRDAATLACHRQSLAGQLLGADADSGVNTEPSALKLIRQEALVECEVVSDQHATMQVTGKHAGDLLECGRRLNHRLRDAVHSSCTHRPLRVHQGRELADDRASLIVEDDDGNLHNPISPAEASRLDIDYCEPAHDPPLHQSGSPILGEGLTLA